VGASSPGIPLILHGRSKYVSWGLSASLSDVSDLFREQINTTSSQYLVDEQWFDLINISKKIKLIQNDNTYKL